MKLQDSEWHDCDARLYACVEWLSQQCDETQKILQTVAYSIQDAEIADTLQNFSGFFTPVKTQVTHLQSQLLHRYQSYVTTVDQVDSILY